MSVLHLQDVSITRGQARVLDRVSFSIGAGECVALLGANGAGKTTLLRAALGLQSCDTGDVVLGGEKASALRPNARAKRVAYLPQARGLAWPMMVRDVVALGRHSCAGPHDMAIDRAIAACALERLQHRSCEDLSGGELSRVHIARVLAQEAPLLLADEPIAALDPAHAHRALALIAGHARAGGAALMVLHDPAIAARYATRLIWLKAGRIIADGGVNETLTPEILEETYATSARLWRDGASIAVSFETPVSSTFRPNWLT